MNRFPLLMKLSVKPIMGLILLFTCSVLSDPPDDSYILVWADEFEGTTLDTNKWKVRYPGPRKEGVVREKNAKLDGKGNLIMILDSEQDGDTTAYYYGMIGTEKTFRSTFGYYEAKMKMHKEEGQRSAFWIQSPTINDAGDTKVAGVEIDIIEYLKSHGNSYQHGVHNNGYTDKESRVDNVANFSEGFHLVAVNWKEDGYDFYANDQKNYSINKWPSHRDEYMVINNGEPIDWTGNVDNADLPDTTFFDYVRVYQQASTDASLTLTGSPLEAEVGSTVEMTFAFDDRIELLQVSYVNAANENTIVEAEIVNDSSYSFVVPDISAQQITIVVSTLDGKVTAEQSISVTDEGTGVELLPGARLNQLKTIFPVNGNLILPEQTLRAEVYDLGGKVLFSHSFSTALEGNILLPVTEFSGSVVLIKTIHPEFSRMFRAVIQ